MHSRFAVAARCGTAALTTTAQLQPNNIQSMNVTLTIICPYQEHQFKLSLHTPHKVKNLICLFFYPSKSTYQSLFPYTSPQYFSPFGINLQKGSIHQKKEIKVDK